jgi:hypothetical protein
MATILADADIPEFSGLTSARHPELPRIGYVMLGAKRPSRIKFAFGVVLLIYCRACLVCFGQHPINDDFTNRTVLAGSSITFTGQLAGSTLELLDPPLGYNILCNNGYSYASVPCGTVWWSWTAETAAPVTIEVTELSHIQLKKAGLGVFSGTNSLGWDWVNNPQTPFDTGRRPHLSFVPDPGTEYQIRASGSTGTVTLRLTATNAPVIVIRPQTQTVSLGGSVYFGVGVAGIPPYSYQWRFNGNDLPAETFAILSLDNLTTNLAGEYSVGVSNATGFVISEPARLFVSVADVQALLIARPRVDPAQFTFMLTGETGRSYRVESSIDLIHWFAETNLPTPLNYLYSEILARERVLWKNGIVFNTNGSGSFTIPVQSRTRFVRARRYDPRDAVINNNLKKLRFASELAALDLKLISFDTPIPPQLTPFLNADFLTNCPGNGCCYVLNEVSENPTCFTGGATLEEPTY